jgi:hypothetical protein
MEGGEVMIKVLDLQAMALADGKCFICLSLVSSVFD